MTKLVFYILTICIVVLQAFASPAAYHDSSDQSLTKRQPQRSRTVTVTETETMTETVTTSSKPKTVTVCTTGASTSRPTTSPDSTSNRPSSTSPVSTAEPTNDGNGWVVPGAGTFDNKQEFTFENGIPSGLESTNYKVLDTEGGAPYDHQFSPRNVIVDNSGVLNLKISAVSADKRKPGLVIKCGEIATTEKNVKYGSIRTVAAFSTVKGACHGIFLYRNDNQETDIEYLTDPDSQANNINQTSSNGDPIPVWYSNQALEPGTTATQEIGPAPMSVIQYHEYRIDWTKDHTSFYVDGVLQKKFRSNVPTKSGPWIWNNWSNGDSGWSAGPPTEDNYFKIKKITMYYNVDESDPVAS